MIRCFLSVIMAALIAGLCGLRIEEACPQDMDDTNDVQACTAIADMKIALAFALGIGVCMMQASKESTRVQHYSSLELPKAPCPERLQVFSLMF